MVYTYNINTENNEVIAVTICTIIIMRICLRNWNFLKINQNSIIFEVETYLRVKLAVLNVSPTQKLIFSYFRCQKSTFWVILRVFGLQRPQKSPKIGFFEKKFENWRENGRECYLYPFWTDWNQSRHIPPLFRLFLINFYFCPPGGHFWPHGISRSPSFTKNLNIEKSSKTSIFLHKTQVEYYI